MIVKLLYYDAWPLRPRPHVTLPSTFPSGRHFRIRCIGRILSLLTGSDIVISIFCMCELKYCIIQTGLHLCTCTSYTCRYYNLEEWEAKQREKRRKKAWKDAQKHVVINVADDELRHKQIHNTGQKTYSKLSQWFCNKIRCILHARAKWQDVCVQSLSVQTIYNIYVRCYRYSGVS